MVSRLLLNLDDDLIEHMVSEVVGEDVLPLLKTLRKKGEKSELDLAEKLNTDVNTVRNMLYRLHQFNLVSSERRRDDENGWYIYWWNFQPRGFEHLFTRLTKKNMEVLQVKLDRESTTPFYACEQGCVRQEFDDAYGMEFRCPECGELMHLKSLDRDRVESLTKQLGALKALVRP